MSRSQVKVKVVGQANAVVATSVEGSFSLVVTCILSGENIYFRTVAVFVDMAGTCAQASKAGSIQCLAVLSQPCRRWRVSRDDTSRH